jgi:hypothetical protein
LDTHVASQPKLDAIEEQDEKVDSRHCFPSGTIHAVVVAGSGVDDILGVSTSGLRTGFV